MTAVAGGLGTHLRALMAHLPEPPVHEWASAIPEVGRPPLRVAMESTDEAWARVGVEFSAPRAARRKEAA